MKRSICIICFVLINIISIKAQTLRNTIALNRNWHFITYSTNKSEAKQWINGLLARSTRINVPHAGNVLNGREDYKGLAWDEKIITLPAQFATDLQLKFEPVYHDGVIYLNGVQLATHTNAGYTILYVHITEQV